eukprot:CAMPEP_0181105604 /NCGR_PEP_ID=MMETSP1071-20121207/16079_1 /TAXON_ID=35127 /ORGANISM="Thalassiosira sp., Strain NH16" /LENGTH=30 /DNA_ID= /DNA_START= /DNA_END= /DNA_ORIENTATION=
MANHPIEDSIIKGQNLLLLTEDAHLRGPAV